MIRIFFNPFRVIFNMMFGYYDDSDMIAASIAYMMAFVFSVATLFLLIYMSFESYGEMLFKHLSSSDMKLYSGIASIVIGTFVYFFMGSSIKMVILSIKKMNPSSVKREGFPVVFLIVALMMSSLTIGAIFIDRKANNLGFKFISRDNTKGVERNGTIQLSEDWRVDAIKTMKENNEAFLKEKDDINNKRINRYVWRGKSTQKGYDRMAKIDKIVERNEAEIIRLSKSIDRSDSTNTQGIINTLMVKEDFGTLFINWSYPFNFLLIMLNCLIESYLERRNSPTPSGRKRRKNSGNGNGNYTETKRKPTQDSFADVPDGQHYASRKNQNDSLIRSLYSEVPDSVKQSKREASYIVNNFEVPMTRQGVNSAIKRLGLRENNRVGYR